MRNRIHRLVALLLVGLLVFSQVATAAHACAVLGVAANASPATTMPRERESPIDLPAVCVAHCQDGVKAVSDQGSFPVVGPPVGAVLRLQVPFSAFASQAFAAAPAPSGLAYRRLQSLHCCWRV